MNYIDGCPHEALDSDLQPSRYRSTLVSHNIVVSGNRTSIRLEPEMWDGLREICQRERSPINKICTTVAMQKLKGTSLTAAIRVYVMRYFRLAATEDGHIKAGHGNGLNFGLYVNTSSYARKPAARLTKTSFS
ncbi:MAG: ribbon-helix-helix domain-containing protein [Alphaproteobacteria bacterium]|nr:ribbon-helix-helix domain-containing protein [Alphaproteobacteria bacterium]